MAGTRARRVMGREQPPRHRYVFVVTYARSGSTLVQGLLNTLPRTLVRGENNLYVHQLFRSVAALKRFQRKHLAHNPQAIRSPFYGLHEIDPASFAVSARTLMTQHMLGSTPPKDVDVLGFKEVAWHRVGAAETRAFFNFLDRAFPGCLYVLNSREHESVAGSGFWQTRDPDNVRLALERVEEIQRFLRKSRPRRTLDLRYERTTSQDRATSDAQLRRLAEFVHGSCDDVLLEQLRATMKTGHGPNPFGKSRGRRKKADAEGASSDETRA